MTTYDKGDLVRFTATFRDLDGALADPTTVSFKLRNGAAGEITEKTYAAGEVARDSAGVFHADASLDAEGEWFYRFEAGGTLVGASEGKVLVRRSFF